MQGVFFRANAREQALLLGLTGYAKNLPDGSVECLVQGTEGDIEDFTLWCRNGSTDAEVTGLAVDYQELEKPIVGFETY